MTSSYNNNGKVAETIAWYVNMKRENWLMIINLNRLITKLLLFLFFWFNSKKED